MTTNYILIQHIIKSHNKVSNNSINSKFIEYKTSYVTHNYYLIKEFVFVISIYETKYVLSLAHFYLLEY